ncbi:MULTISPECIES: ABC transporter ATP-binding protein [Clostridium]|uniref:ABC transporter ATP-binding protein n=1 Tax=Clostridium TaxID=1485 RepID=UPI00082655B1|nr:MULTISPECIES: ABC transporter ATP-binding protein [Clostridium]PJI09608.1 ABC transporter ATP-binding protein [Clostridium sp. CT7]
MNCLKTKDLYCGYNKKAVIENINFSANEGEMICLLGPNGAGKTTILRTISGLLPPVKGDVYINGKNLLNIKKTDLAKTLSVVLTQKTSFDLMTVFEVAALGRYPHTGFFGKLSKDDENKISNTLKDVGAFNLINRYFDELSDGEKQKVMLARALVQEPKIIILDEPTTHLDINHKIELLNTLKKLSIKNKISVILSLHEIDLALKYCDKVMLIKNKKAFAFGEPENILDDSTINKLYNIENANFSKALCSIEVKNQLKNSIYVIGGCGMGTPIYRLLTKCNIGFSTGILHKNDIDYEIAKTMCLNIQSEEPFEKISSAVFEKALKIIDLSDIIIDSGVKIGEINKKNMDLINYALEKNKKVITLRKNFNDKVISCSDAVNIINYIRRYNHE